MSDFYKDLLNGSGTLSGRTPDTGAAPTAPDVDLQDGVYIQAAADALLTSVILDGAGAAQVDNTICTSENLILKLPTPPTADFFCEVTVLVTPTADSCYIGLIGRASPDPNTAPYGLNFAGGYFSITGADSINVETWYNLNGASGSYGSSGASGADYPAGPYTIVLRSEYEGATMRFKVDGTIVHTVPIVDAEFLPAGEAYLFFDFDTFTANLTDLKILSMRAGTLPEAEGDFWTAFVKTTEDDA